VIWEKKGYEETLVLSERLAQRVHKGQREARAPGVKLVLLAP